MTRHACLDPAIGGDGIEVARMVGVARGMAGDMRPDVRPDRVVATPSHEIPDDLGVAQRDRPARSFGVPLGQDLSTEVVDRRQQWLDQAVRRMALRQQQGSAVEVLFGEGENLDASHDPRR